MKKVIFKESEKTFLTIDIILYVIYTIIGYVLIGFSEAELLSPVDYAPVLFYVFGFFAIIAYFANRRVDDYEYLFFGLINVTTATYISINSFYGDESFIMSAAIILYTISVVLNKSYHVYRLINNKDINFYPKMVSTILVIMLGLLIVGPLFVKYCAANIILGYYFVSFGLVNLLEPLFMVLMRNPRIDKKLTSIFGIENEKKSKNKKVVLKEIKKKKIKNDTKE